MTAAEGVNGYTPAGEDDWIVHPEWCGWETWVLSYVCETYLDAPIWNTVLIGDAVALWMILAICHRERELKRKAERERASVPKVVRSRRSWQKLAMMVRLATLRGSKGTQDSSWSLAWQQASRQRLERKDYLRRREFEISAVLMRAAGPLILGCMWLLIAFEAHAFFTIGLPWLDLGPRAHTVAFALCAMYAVRILVNYALVALTDPGRPPKSGSAVGPAAEAADVELASSSQARHCAPCGAAKPPRCHHCRVCGRCVLKMDHHCPFVNNCIGLQNYRHFCNFLFDLVVGCILVILALAGPTFNVLRRHVDGMTFPHQVHIVVAFGICLLAECSLGPFLLFHLSLILVNETTLETMGRRFARGNALKKMVSYDRGAVANFEEVCGPLPAWLRRMPVELLLGSRHAKRCE